MKSLWAVIWRGILLWALLFGWSVLIFRYHESNRPLFETLISLGEVCFTVLFGARYLEKVRGNHLRAGLAAGLIWAAINILLDLPLFSWGPMKRPLVAYMQDIGFAYLAIPMIMVGMGWLANRSASRRPEPDPPTLALPSTGETAANRLPALTPPRREYTPRSR